MSFFIPGRVKNNGSTLRLTPRPIMVTVYCPNDTPSYLPWIPGSSSLIPVFFNVLSSIHLRKGLLSPPSSRVLGVDSVV